MKKIISISKSDENDKIISTLCARYFIEPNMTYKELSNYIKNENIKYHLDGRDSVEYKFYIDSELVLDLDTVIRLEDKITCVLKFK